MNARGPGTSLSGRGRSGAGPDHRPTPRNAGQLGGPVRGAGGESWAPPPLRGGGAASRAREGRVRIPNPAPRPPQTAPPEPGQFRALLLSRPEAPSRTRAARPSGDCRGQAAGDPGARCQSPRGHQTSSPKSEEKPAPSPASAFRMEAGERIAKQPRASLTAVLGPRRRNLSPWVNTNIDLIYTAYDPSPLRGGGALGTEVSARTSGAK